MRIISLIILVLLNGAALAASPVGASYSEEMTASWECDTEALLHGDQVFSDLRNKNGDGLRANALCSYESLKKIEALRNLTADIISESENTGSSGHERKLAGEILKSIGSVSFTSLNGYEQNLVRISEDIFVSDFCFHMGDLSSGNFPSPEYALTQSMIPLTISSSHKMKNNKVKNIDTILSDKNIICSKNLFDMEFADLYRLFLYVKDNSGNRKKILTINKLAHLCLRQSLYNSTRYINTTVAGNPIHPHGVLL